MILLIRFILVILIIYLLIRAFSGFSRVDERKEKHHGLDNNNSGNGKKISKKTGEYVDYEEVDK